MPNVMRTVGLTGGIASGKSTVANILRKRGVTIIDADQLAREVVAPGTPGLSDLVQAFGSSILDASGSLLRAQLAQKIFSSPGNRQLVETITHPRIHALYEQRIAELAAQGHSIVVYEAALIIEKHLERDLDWLIVVAAKFETQLSRLMQRDAICEEQARARLNAQAPLLDKLAAADYVIFTDGTLAETELRTHEVWRAIEGQ